MRRTRFDDAHCPVARTTDLLGDWWTPLVLRELLANLASKPDGEARLLDRTMVLYGSNMGDANVHNNTNLPILLAGLSHCFRTEAGSHGKESRGLYRVHQFTKVELFAFTAGNFEESAAMHQRLLAIEEEIFQALEIPYRVIDIASGDLGGPAYRKFDLEAWMPGRGEAGEWGDTF